MFYDTALGHATIIGLAVSLVLSASLVFTHRWLKLFTEDRLDGIQNVHSGSVPRVGGFAILLSLVLATALLAKPDSQLMFLLLLAVLPTWFFGIAEDITKTINTTVRLFATMFSGLLAWWLTGYSIKTVDLPWIDAMLAFTPVAVTFTFFAVAGVAHAVNLIDGFNGLASGTVLICLTALGWIAVELNHTELSHLVLVLIAVVLGFFILNYPFGKLFLGDGGAYTLGFFLAWISVMLVSDADGLVSPWAPFLICAYPILETLFSMLRRVLSNRRMDHPDRTHLHSLVYRRLIPRLFPNTSKTTRNALTSPFLWLFAAGPALAGIFLYGNTWACISAIAVTAFIYVLLYRRLTRFRWL
jgi:UDP-N-acetylmuramyl pentapeptide phosphotransferase/UDP-N-acetylglucosamine-1-phosphate transferase